MIKSEIGNSRQSAVAVESKEVAGTVKSAARVLELLSFFAERRRPLTVTDVARGLGYPQSSASALLTSLTRSGHLNYDRYNRQYMPTLRVALLGAWVHDQLFTPKNLSRLVDELHAASGRHTVLGMQNEIYVQYVHLVQSTTVEESWYLKPGALRPLCRAAVGKMLLSRKADVDVLYLLRRINADESDPANLVNASNLLEELDVIRRQGYALTDGQVVPGRGAVAVALPTPPSQPPMAIGLGGPSEIMKVEYPRYLELLREALLPYSAIDLKTRADVG